MLSEWEEHGNAVMHVIRSTHRVQWKMTATPTCNSGKFGAQGLPAPMRILSWYLAARGCPR